MSLERRILDLENGIEQLVESYELLNEDLRLQKLENLELTKLVKEQNEQLNLFHNREKIAKIANSAVGEDVDKKELKQKLNQYIKLVDECISRLSA